MNDITKQQLKAKAHKLNPIIMIGAKGLTDNVSIETDRALTDHELIKVKIAAPKKKECIDIAEKLADYCQAQLVQVIGHTAIFYRKND